MLIVAAALAAPDVEPAGEDAPAQVSLTVDPLTTALGYVHLQTEVRLGGSFSVYAGPHLRLFTPPWSDPEPYRGYGGELGVRWFPWKHAPTGPWVMTRGVLASLHSDGVSGVGGYASVLVGATWMPKAPKGRLRPVLSGGAGIQRIAYRIEGFGPDGFFPALHTAVGVGW